VQPDPSTTALPFGVPLPERSPRELLQEKMAAIDPDGPKEIEVAITVRDGIELAADVYLPAAAQLPAPAIVIGTPYDKQRWANEAVYRDHGYPTVVYDVRGRGKSEGTFHVFDRNENRDGHDVVEWVAQQDWCNGKVACTGLSYMGWTTWATIEQKPPHLTCAVSLSPAGRWQQELPYTYGCFWGYFVGWFGMMGQKVTGKANLEYDLDEVVRMLPVGAIGDVINPPGPSWQEFLEHEALDDYWWQNRWDGKYDFDVPVLHITGWHDREDIQGAFHHYEQMMLTSPARDRQWLLVGPWTHGGTRTPHSTHDGVDAPGGGIDMTAVHLRFFDRFLRDVDNGVDDEPRVRLYDTGARAWQKREAWQGGTTDRRFFLGAGWTLLDEPGGDGSDTHRYDPLDAPGSFVRKGGEPGIVLTELEAHPGVVTWTSAPLAEDVKLHGWPFVELFVAVDCDDTEWHVKLADVEPDGRSLCVGWGCLRASHGKDPANPQAITPGEVERYEIEVTPAFHTFQAGHRIRLVLAGSEFPWFTRNLNRFEPIATQSEPRVATNTVHFGAATPSCIRLPVEG
jgi:putative CocE/NonD family hydrolase